MSLNSLLLTFFVIPQEISAVFLTNSNVNRHLSFSSFATVTLILCRSFQDSLEMEEK